MIKKRIVAGIVSAIIIILATAIVIFEKSDTDSRTTFIDLYFLNETDTSIVSENRELKYSSANELPRVVIDALIAGPISNKNHPIFEKETKLLSINKKNSALLVDFSKEYYNDDSSKMFLTTYAVVKSLCQLNGVKRVMVTVDSQEIIASDGTVVGYLSDDDIDLVTDTKTKDSKSFTLYFIDKETQSLTKEIRTIKITDTIPAEQYIVNELIKGPQSDVAKAAMTPDTELISAQTTDGVCFLNFKASFIEKNSSNCQLVVDSIVKSLCELDGVSGVQFLIDGKKTDTFGEINIADTIYVTD